MTAPAPVTCVGCSRKDAACVRSFIGWVCPRCLVELKAVQRWQSDVNKAAGRRVRAERKADQHKGGEP